MSLHTPQEWQNTSGFTMSQARDSHRRATHQNDASRRAHDETVTENMGRYSALQGSLEQKVADSQKLVENLQRRMESLQNSIAKTQHNYTLLEAAHHAKDPQIQLCLWRLAQREKRPLREQVRDSAEGALEQEKVALVETQKKLADNMKKTKAIITELEDKLAEVRHDLEHKIQALGIDETCLKTTMRSQQAAAEMARPGQTMNATIPQHKAVNAPRSLQETTRNETNRIQDGHRLAQLGMGREEKAKALRDENQMLINRCQKMADDALSKSERHLQERCAENQAMRRRLEADIRDVKAKIDHTKDTMAETKAQIRALEEPTENAATCASHRRQRATREHIHDPVSTRIQEHQLSTHRAIQDLQGHHAQEKAHLQDLGERLARLQEDLRDKGTSLNIDQNCLTHQTGHHTLTLPLNYSAKSRLSARRSDAMMSAPGSNIPVLPMTAR